MRALIWQGIEKLKGRRSSAELKVNDGQQVETKTLELEAAKAQGRAGRSTRKD